MATTGHNLYTYYAEPINTQNIQGHTKHILLNCVQAATRKHIRTTSHILAIVNVLTELIKQLDFSGEAHFSALVHAHINSTSEQHKIVLEQIILEKMQVGFNFSNTVNNAQAHEIILTTAQIIANTWALDNSITNHPNYLKVEAFKNSLVVFTNKDFVFDLPVEITNIGYVVINYHGTKISGFVNKDMCNIILGAEKPYIALNNLSVTRKFDYTQKGKLKLFDAGDYENSTGKVTFEDMGTVIKALKAEQVMLHPTPGSEGYWFFEKNEHGEVIEYLGSKSIALDGWLAHPGTTLNFHSQQFIGNNLAYKITERDIDHWSRAILTEQEEIAHKKLASLRANSTQKQTTTIVLGAIFADYKSTPHKQYRQNIEEIVRNRNYRRLNGTVHDAILRKHIEALEKMNDTLLLAPRVIREKAYRAWIKKACERINIPYIPDGGL